MSGAFREMGDVVRRQHPLTLPATATVRAACTAMRDRKVGCVLVTDAAGRLVGIFTGRDAVCRVLATGKSAARTSLGDVMTPGPASMPPDVGAVEALRLMRDGGYRHVPVVDGDVIVGVASSGDFRGLEQDRLEQETELFEHMR